MKTTVLKFGLIAGAILSLMLLVTLQLKDLIGFDYGAVVGYTTMVLAFLLIFFGVRSYRDGVGGGVVSFWRAFAVGTLIAVVASVCYVATWELVYFKLNPGFLEAYEAHVVEKARASGQSAEAIERTRAEMQRFAVMYQNPFFNAAITFIEPMPVGLLVAAVSAGVLRRRGGGTLASPERASTTA